MSILPNAGFSGGAKKRIRRAASSLPVLRLTTIGTLDPGGGDESDLETDSIAYFASEVGGRLGGFVPTEVLEEMCGWMGFVFSSSRPAGDVGEADM